MGFYDKIVPFIVFFPPFVNTLTSGVISGFIFSTNQSMISLLNLSYQNSEQVQVLLLDQSKYLAVLSMIGRLYDMTINRMLLDVSVLQKKWVFLKDTTNF